MKSRTECAISRICLFQAAEIHQPFLESHHWLHLAEQDGLLTLPGLHHLLEMNTNLALQHTNQNSYQVREQGWLCCRMGLLGNLLTASLLVATVYGATSSRHLLQTSKPTSLYVASWTHFLQEFHRASCSIYAASSAIWACNEIWGTTIRRWQYNAQLFVRCQPIQINGGNVAFLKQAFIGATSIMWIFHFWARNASIMCTGHMQLNELEFIITPQASSWYDFDYTKEHRSLAKMARWNGSPALGSLQMRQRQSSFLLSCSMYTVWLQAEYRNLWQSAQSTECFVKSQCHRRSDTSICCLEPASKWRVSFPRPPKRQSHTQTLDRRARLL